MTIQEILSLEKEIWKEQNLTLPEMIIRHGVTMGDLCRIARRANKDSALQTPEELQKELGNLITSSVRFCADLGFDPDVCVERSLECQRKFVRENPQT
ncbi:hypothetical protein HYW18_02255 [Candidatus Uhrbacteria bacterium]|nr:hypothetical protein [Candidatus Uhrbacteria bacterium]